VCVCVCAVRHVASVVSRFDACIGGVDRQTDRQTGECCRNVSCRCKHMYVGMDININVNIQKIYKYSYKNTDVDINTKIHKI
jgi:hypothetical protein